MNRPCLEAKQRLVSFAMDVHTIRDRYRREHIEPALMTRDPDAHAEHGTASEEQRGNDRAVASGQRR